MQPEIIDRGRGPQISGTRITVYDILDYEGEHHTYVAAMLGLSSEQVNFARKYIEENIDEVMLIYRRILDRDARGNPPELQIKLDAMQKEYRGRITTIMTEKKAQI